MSEDQLEELRNDVREIKMAILGQVKIGHIGLVERVADHDRRLSRLERIVIWGTGALAVAWTFMQFLKDRLLK